MKIVNLKTKEEVEVSIGSVNIEEFGTIGPSQQFSFDWNREREKEVFKLTVRGKNEIIGLLSYTDIPTEQRIHINLIESSIEQRGKGKLYSGIPGCLLSFTAKESFIKGYNGFVSLTPKSILIDYYLTTYRFVRFGRNLAIEGKASYELIQKYELT